MALAAWSRANGNSRRCGGATTGRHSHPRVADLGRAREQLRLPQPQQPRAVRHHLGPDGATARWAPRAHGICSRPLGIKDAIRPADPKGRTHGWGDLHLRPHDLAKIGYLYLHAGRWNGRQAVSEAWVRQPIAPA